MKGFTLVELSIVLVIMGLLIGGILVGQSLIETARINKVVSYIKQTEVAITVYKRKFKKLPGDDPLAYAKFSGGNSTTCGPANPINSFSNSEHCSGNGDNILAAREGFRAWHHLQLAGMLDFKLDPSTSLMYGMQAMGNVDTVLAELINVGVPSFGLKNTGVVMYNLYAPNCVNGLTMGYPGTGGGNYASAYRSQRAITAQTAYILDNKIDDGSPDTGDMIGSGRSWGGCGTTASSYSTHIPTDYNPKLALPNGCAINWCLDKAIN